MSRISKVRVTKQRLTFSRLEIRATFEMESYTAKDMEMLVSQLTADIEAYFDAQIRRQFGIEAKPLTPV